MTLVGNRFRTLFLFLCLLFVVGCGSSDSDFVATSSGSGASVPIATVRLESVLAQTAIPSSVDSLRATGFDDELNLRYGPVAQEKAATVEWKGVPVDVTDFVIEYLSQGQVVGIAQIPLTLSAGETFVITNPTILGVSSTLQSVSLTPPTVSLPSGTSASLALTGHFSDGSTLNLTSAAGWTSSAPTVVVDAGTARGAEPGTATVTASFGGKSAQAQVTVTDATLVSLRLSPNSPAIAAGTSQDFTVEGLYSDGSFEDVTDDVAWESSDTNVATVINGTAQGVVTGQTTITASLDGKSDSTVLTVTSATLTSLEIDTTGGLLSIAKGTSTTFKAVGYFSNGSEQDLTSSAVWESNSASASVVKGLVHGETTGSGIEISASFDGKSDVVTIDVTAAELASLRVKTVADDGLTLVNVGDTIEFEAIATYSDGNEQGVTGDASWVSSDGNTASVANGNPNGGTVTGVSAGQADITATFGGKTAELRVTVQVAPLPDLALQNGTYTFNTDTGVLTPQMGDSTTAPGWNSSEKRLVLNSFTVPSGATLNLESDETSLTPFKVKAESHITVGGKIHFDGTDGDDGTDGVDGAPGTAGGDVNLFCLGDITVTGIISANGGHGGAGGSYTVSDNNTGTVSGGNGGRGGESGQFQFHAGDSLDTTSATLNRNGGNGGAGGAVSIGGTNNSTATATAGAGGHGGDGGTQGGDGGAGGKVSIVGSNNSSATAKAGAGGDGGEGGTQGGEGGVGGVVSIGGNNNSNSTATGGAGGDGGDGGAQGGDGGAGGAVTIGGYNSSSAIATGGAGGDGGDGDALGGNGGAGGNVTINGTNYGTRTGGAGGAGGEPGGTDGSPGTTA